MIPIEEKEGWLYLAVKKLYTTFLRGTTLKNHFTFYCLNYLHLLEQKINSTFVKKYVKTKIFVEL